MATESHSRDLQAGRYVIALDMDYFYCQVELRKRPDIKKNHPVGAYQRNLVVTCNYPARAAGVKKLMLVEDAYKVCPELILLNASDLKDYRIACHEIICLLKETLGGVFVENLGLDEFFIDVTEIVRNRRTDFSSETSVKGYCWPCEERDKSIYLDTENTRDFVVASQVCHEIRKMIWTKLQLTCSGGISNSKLLSKLVANVHKPDEQTILLPQYAESFLSNISLKQLPGIGPVTYQTLVEHFSVSTCEQLRFISMEQLSNAVGIRTGIRLFNICRGIDEEQVQDTSLVKSISCEERLSRAESWSDVERYIVVVLERLLDRLVEHATVYSGRYARSLLVSYLRTPSTKREVISSSVPFDLIRLCKMCNPAKSSTSEYSYKFSNLRSLVLKQLESRCCNLLRSRLGSNFALCLVSVGVKNFVVAQGAEQSICPNSIVPMFRNKVDSNCLSADSKTPTEETMKCFICDTLLNKNMSNEDVNRHIDRCLLTLKSEQVITKDSDPFNKSKKQKLASSSSRS